MSVNKYLQQNLGSTMTEKVYGQQVLKLLQYQDYANAYADRLTYTDEQLEEAYQADTKTYDKASWEYVVVSGAAESTTDADGNTVQPTDEETEAAKAAAKETADKILAAYKAGTSLESAAGNYEKASYYSSDSTTYYDGTTGNWLFDGARQERRYRRSGGRQQLLCGSVPQLRPRGIQHRGCAPHPHSARERHPVH